jgi:hypothetical protein
VSRGQIRFLLAAAQRALEIAAAVSHNVWPEGSVAEGSCAQGGARTIPNRSTVRTLLRLVCDTAAVRKMHRDTGVGPEQVIAMQLYADFDNDTELR